MQGSIGRGGIPNLVLTHRYSATDAHSLLFFMVSPQYGVQHQLKEEDLWAWGLVNHSSCQITPHWLGKMLVWKPAFAEVMWCPTLTF